MKNLTLEQIEELSSDFKAISDPGRLQIVLLLIDGEKTVGEIASLLNASQSVASQKLKILKEAKILRCRKDGKESYYYISDDHIRNIIEMSIEHLVCEG